MPVDTRTNTPNEKLAELLEFGTYTVKSGGQTNSLNAAAAAGQKVLSVASGGASFTAGMLIAVGSFNTLEVGKVASSTATSITLQSNLAFAHASGEAIKELTTTVLGEVSEDGFSDSLSVGVELHRVATRHGIWDSTAGQHEQLVEARVLNATLDNWLRAFGLDDAANKDSGGTGTSNDPWFLDVNPERVLKALRDWAGAISGRIPAVYVKGEYLNDGKTFLSEYWSCRPAGGDMGFDLKLGTPTPVVFRYHWFANNRRYRF